MPASTSRASLRAMEDRPEAPGSPTEGTHPPVTREASHARLAMVLGLAVAAILIPLPVILADGWPDNDDSVASVHPGDPIEHILVPEAQYHEPVAGKDRIALPIGLSA